MSGAEGTEVAGEGKGMRVRQCWGWEAGVPVLRGIMEWVGLGGI